MHGEYKVSGDKLVVIDLEVDQDVLVDVTPSGDFFLDPDSALTRMMQVLEGVCASTSAKEIAEFVEISLESDDILMGIIPATVGTVARRALGHALNWEGIDFEVIHSPVVSPIVNVTSGETLVEGVTAKRRKPFIRLWEWNGLQIVIGPLQSYQDEIQPEGVERHGILASRRVTGGGTTFMESGNCITYSLVVPAALVEGMSSEQSYPFLDQWVMEVLEKVGIKTKYMPLNDIASEVGKIDGTAQKRWSNGYMVHHVMMTYDIDAEKMNEVLRIDMERIRDKGVRSAVKRIDLMRSQTGFLRKMILKAFYDHFTQKYRMTPSEITEVDLAKAEERCVTKFAIEEWIHRIP